MKKWIKLETNLLSDERVKNLIADYGMKGFGLYVAMRSFVENTEKKCVPLAGLLTDFCKYASRATLENIIHDYNLFDECPVLVNNVSRAGVRAAVREGVPAPKPITEENIEKKTTQKKESCFSDFVAEMKEEDGEWRNVVCMHSGIGKLLLAHWQEAVEQWREHVIAYDTVNEIFDYSRARYYFNSYVKQSTEAGRRLKEHLSALEAQPCEVEEKENDLWR